MDCLEHVLRLVLDPTSPSPLPSQILPETSGRRVVEVTKELARVSGGCDVKCMDLLFVRLGFETWIVTGLIGSPCPQRDKPGSGEA